MHTRRIQKLFYLCCFSKQENDMTHIQFHDWIIFLKKKECQYTVFLCPLCTYPFSKIFMNMLTLECPLLHICLRLPKSPALQITLIRSSFKSVKSILLNRYMSVPWKVWISESRWKYKRMLLKNVLISLNSYSSRQDLAKKKTKLSWKTCYFVDEEV